MHMRNIFAAGIVITSLLVVAEVALAAPPDDALPPGQVYECLNNGQRVFSDKRCGPNASIRQLSTLNTMTAPASAPPSVRPPPQYHYPPEAGYGPDSAAEDQAEDYSGGSEPSVVYYGVARRGINAARSRPPRRHVHTHRAPAAHAAMSGR